MEIFSISWKESFLRVYPDVLPYEASKISVYFYSYSSMDSSSSSS